MFSGMSERAATVTRLLLDWGAGDDAARDRLVPHVYDELRRIARRHMRGERSDHTLQTTALIHEAYLRLVTADVEWQDRAHFYAVAAQQMRRVLVDHARARQSAKRGGGFVRVTLNEHTPAHVDPDEDLLLLDRALTRLRERDARAGSAIELHYFAGLTQPEIAAALDVGEATVKRDLRFAKAWLKSEIEGAGDGH